MKDLIAHAERVLRRKYASVMDKALAREFIKLARRAALNADDMKVVNALVKERKVRN